MRFLCSCNSHCGGVLLVLQPVLSPHRETIPLVEDASMNGPFEVEQPLELHLIQLGNGDAADFSPGAILESVVVQKFATKEQRYREHSVDRSRRLVVVARS